jgi:hypothetical protein
MENWIQEALSSWETANVKLNSPASLLEIEKAELKLNFTFPEGFKQLYLIVNGFEGFDWQEHMFSLWSLEKIIVEYNDSDSSNYIAFSDFLLGSNFIGFNIDKPGLFKKYSIQFSDLVDGELIAKSFEEVVEMINSSNDLIY